MADPRPGSYLPLEPTSPNASVGINPSDCVGEVVAAVIEVPLQIAIMVMEKMADHDW